MDDPHSINWRQILLFGGGVAAGILAGRFLLPVLAGASSAASAASGDVFEDLAADHHAILDLLDEMEATGTSLLAKRIKLYAELKRDLGRHALAEEGVVYPLLRQRAGREEAARALFAEHAEMKMAVAELEEMVPEPQLWSERVRALRELIAHHAFQEENVEFPALRAALDQQNRVMVSGKVSREKALLT
ncbi:MAG: hemerythrin domain-containing protein [Candidatus Velthaea sp.]